MPIFGFPSGGINRVTGTKKLPFNQTEPYKLFIDINSCFATIEQQYNPKLRGKPIAIAAYTGPTGCVIAASVEAKKLGIKTGFRVKEAQKICPNIIIMEPNPFRYRAVHKKLKELLYTYTPKIIPKSIDEFCIDIEKTPAEKVGAVKTALAIKRDIKTKVGDWITVSIGIGPNEFLAKTASNLEKPDGLRVIDKSNFQQVFSKLKLTDLCGIKSANASRLAAKKIFTVLNFYNANIKELCTAFGSIDGYYWHMRIHGWDMATSSQPQEIKKSFGNSFALPGKLQKKEDLAPVLYELVEKTATRLRREGYKAKSFSLNINYRDGTLWKDHKNTGKYTDETAEIYRLMFKLLAKCPHEKPIRVLAETCFKVAKTSQKQLGLFESTSTAEKRDALYDAIDKINLKHGDMTIKPAELLKAKNFAKDRIAFGK